MVASSSSYDVFINYRGVDVKQTFANHLYRGLLNYGLRIFLSAPKLQPGDDLTPHIEGAIKTASVHVAIFSARYADSSWCLHELLLMLESKDATIIPVFYKVKPSELRSTEGVGVYAQALQRLAQKTTTTMRYDSKIIGSWKKALSLVADISGFELEASNGDEGDLLDKVIQAVLKKLKKVPFLDTGTFGANYRAGLNEKVKDFENEVFYKHHQSAKPQIVGIFGLGGVGKTTLAKELFDKKMSHNMKSCFLYNVRENAAKGSLTSLQSRLLEILKGPNVLIDSIDKGKEELRKHLSSYSVLVVLDDVDDVDQIDALVPVRTDLLSDSLIIITSRDKGVIENALEKAPIYKLTGLNKVHSRELFCAHAFSQPLVPQGFESLVDNFLEGCVRLPLFLKVFGALLHGKKKQSEWKEVLDKLQKVPPTEIQESLQISYQNLKMDEREMFLDAACFFRGQKRDTAIRIWDGSGWNGRFGFQTLHDRCLLELDIEKNIQMHDHLRDFGRVLAGTSSPRRFWHCTDMNAMLGKFPVTTVRGIRMVLGDYKDDVDAFGRDYKNDVDAFGSVDMSTLQLVDTENAMLERILRRPMHFLSLIWLRWNRCPESSLASWLPVKNLRVLQVSGSELRTLWEDESEAPLQLREMEINAPLSSIPKSIGRLKHLERIVVRRFLSRQVNLTELPQEFCDLQSLKALVLTECSKMKSLPYSFGNLTSLQHIDLSFCRNLERLPDSFGKLTSLQHIDLSECHDLESLPDSIGGLRRLQHIILRGCHNLKILPNSFGDLRDLRHINLSGCHDLEELPDFFGNLIYIEHIDLQGCHNLMKLPNSFRDLINLQHINLSNCYDLKSLTDSFGYLTNLEYINLSGCHNLERLPDSFRNLIKLKYLGAEGCSNLITETLELSAHLVAQQRCLEQLYLSDEEHLYAQGGCNLTIQTPELSAHLEVVQQRCLEQLPLSYEEHRGGQGCSNSTIETPELSAHLEVVQQRCLEQLPSSYEEHLGG